MKFVVIDKYNRAVCKNGTINDLYKNCGFKKADGFNEQYVWYFDTINIHIYGRNKGSQRSINLSISNIPLSGKFALVASSKDGQWIDFDVSKWEEIKSKMYNHEEEEVGSKCMYCGSTLPDTGYITPDFGCITPDFGCITPPLPSCDFS